MGRYYRVSSLFGLYDVTVTQTAMKDWALLQSTLIVRSVLESQGPHNKEGQGIGTD